ncbi:T9SS type A sorting domain-containing protein [Caldithrix abyssi]
MKKSVLFLGITLILLIRVHAQNASLFPHATWLQDVHWAGTIYAGIGAPVMVDVQAHAGEHGELTFYLKNDAEKVKPLIDEIHAQGQKYWLNLDASRLEGITGQDIVNDGQGITDTLFGAHVSLEGYVSAIKKSINRPAWRNYVIACIKRAIEAGADGSQHDGAWPPFDSFDEDDLEAFKQYVIDNGVNAYDWDYNNETFAEYLLRKGKTDDNVFDNENDPVEVQELVDDWKSFKALHALESWQMVRDSCQAFAQSLGQNYSLAINAASDFGTRNGHVYLAGDYYIGEFFGWGNYYPLTGSVTARAKMAEAFGKRFICWSSPTLEDIDDGDPNTGYGIEIESEAEKILAAQLYASGGLPQLKYPANRTYPVFYLAQNNSDLLNSVFPFGETAVLMSQAQMIQDNRGLQGLVVVLQDINRSLEIKWLKSNLLYLQDDFSLNDILGYKVVFLPEVFYLTDNQKNVLLNYMDAGGTIVAVRGNVEYCGQYNEHGDENTVPAWTSIADQSNSGIFTYGNGRYINIAHNINEPSGYPPYLYGLAYLNYKADPDMDYLAAAIRDTIQKWMDEAIPIHEVYSASPPTYVRFFRYQDSTQHNYLYHVLSDSVILDTRKPVPVEAFTVELAVSANSYGRLFKATWYSIDNPEGVEIGNDLVVDQNTGRVSVTIPAFFRWGFVHLDGSESVAQTLKIGNLAINGSMEFRRLKSKADVTGSWEVLSGTPDQFEVEVWTNIRNVGAPVISNQTTGKAVESSALKKEEFDKKYLDGAIRLLTAQISAANTEYAIDGSALHDSVVYLYRVRAIQNTDTSAWIHRFFYRNAPPGAPHESQIFTALQNLWYYTDGASSPPDTSYHPIIAFNKAPNYGGDYELDSLLYGFYVYTDSLANKQGDTLSTLHLIGKQFKHKLAWNQSMPDARGDIQDTVEFSLEPYENFGIYFRAIATDGIDSSAFSPWFWFYLDNHNDPPNPFHLIEPTDYSNLEAEVPFKWTNNGDPDPFNKENLTISRVEILFDSLPTFASPGLKVYTMDRSGDEFENDTVVVNLPSNFFNAEGLSAYPIVYWKARMYDYDWHSADGSNRLFNDSQETFTFFISGSSQNLTTPQLKSPVDHAQFLPLFVKLEWQPVNGAEFYILQVAKDAYFNTKIVDDPNVKKTDFMVGKLEPKTTYFWRVKARNTSGQSNWSPVWQFTTLAPPDPVVLIFPGNNITVLTDTVHFSWFSAKPFAERYGFEYSTDQTFSNPFVDTTVVDTVYRLTGFSSGQTYYWRVRAFNQAGWGNYSVVRNFKVELTAIEQNIIPEAYELSQNFPNPFNPSTCISFSLPERANVKMELFNAKGQKVKTVYEGEKPAGKYQIEVELSGLPSGVYFYKMSSKRYSRSRKMILLK